MLTAVDKLKINKYLKEHSIDDLYYVNLCDAIGKRGKIKDIEFLEYFVEAVLKEFNKEEKISMKHVSKIVSVISSFIEWIHDDEGIIDEQLLDKIRSLEEYYDAYLNRTNYSIDLEFTDGVLVSLLDKVNELYPTESKNESVVKYLQEIDRLKDEVKSLSRTLEELNTRYKNLTERCDKKEKALQAKNIEYAHANQSLFDKEKEIEGLQTMISSLEAKISQMEKELLSFQELNEDLFAEIDPLKQRSDSLASLVEELRATIQELSKQIDQLTVANEELASYKDKYEALAPVAETLQKEENQRKIEKEESLKNAEMETRMQSLIYQYLLVEGLTIDSILLKLQSDGYSTSKDFVYRLLQTMKSKIHIDSGTFSLSPEYRILAPKVDEDGSFHIQVPKGCKSYDILLVSDFHLKDFDETELKIFDKINEYCTDNHISLILNLGDFFDGVVEETPSYEGAMQNYQYVEKAISLIPRKKGIYHAVLGGNHDDRMLSYGIDPMQMIADEREDFLSLGYSHCTVTFNGTKSLLSSFALHHPSSFDYQIHLKKKGFDSTLLLEDLERYYLRQGRVRNDSYVDILGHMHKSFLHYPDSYYFVPAFAKYHSLKEACHLRVYFDEKTQIKYMVFMPLVLQNKMIKASEMVYKKILS